MPRFQPGNYAANLLLFEGFDALAREVGCTKAQLALTWLLAQDACIVPLPGTTRMEHFEENLGASGLQLGADIVARLEVLINQGTVSGARYAASTQAEVDTEEF